MNLPDTFIQKKVTCIAFKAYVSSVPAFPGNQTQDLGVALLFELQEHKLMQVSMLSKHNAIYNKMCYAFGRQFYPKQLSLH